MVNPPERRTDVLYFIVCGGPPAAEASTFVRAAQEAGWDVCVIATPSATRFVNVRELVELTAHPVRSDYKLPHEADVLPPANAIVVAPATFNTINKWVGGIADTLAVSLLSEYLSLNVPLIVAPNVNPALARHPQYQHGLTRLRKWEVTVLHDPSAPFPTWMVPWEQILKELGEAYHGAPPG
jgi:phosphopantothenoylcysteine synthetase/decarboxylase